MFFKAIPANRGIMALASRCKTCGKLISGKPLWRKTCCVNKVSMFCSKTCLDSWSRGWLKRQL